MSYPVKVYLLTFFLGSLSNYDSNKKVIEQKLSALAIAFHIFIHFFAVYYKNTTTWNDQIQSILKKVDHEG